MTLQLSGNLERGKNQYESFPGCITHTMPVLIEQGYEPASVAIVVDRRENAPEEVVRAWQGQYFWTGDGTSTDKTGGAVLTLDTKLLRTINSSSRLPQGALPLSSDGWEVLKADDASIILSRDEVEEAYGRGLVKKEGRWVPVNRSVGKAVDHFLRGKNFQTYAQMVSDASGDSEVLRQYFDCSKPSQPHLRFVIVYSIRNNSYVLGNDHPINNLGFLVGVAPELSEGKSRTEQGGVTRALVACENLGVVRTPTARELVDVLYEHFQTVSLAKGATKRKLHRILRKYL